MGLFCKDENLSVRENYSYLYEVNKGNCYCQYVNDNRDMFTCLTESS